MTRTFVIVNDTVHSLLRNVTRHVPLCACPVEAPRGVEYRFTTEDLPDDYFTLAAYHCLRGLPAGKVCRSHRQVPVHERLSILHRANYFDAVRLDRRCGRDLRQKFSLEGPVMLAAELLVFGVGMLRACNDDPDAAVQQRLWQRFGRLTSRHEEVFARIGALHGFNVPLRSHFAQKETYESTNLVFGDAFGEIEQIWDRRADTVFLEHLAAALQHFRAQAEAAAYLEPPLNLAGLFALHHQHALWRTPPLSGRSLLRRVEFLLNHAVMDGQPETRFEPPTGRRRSGAAAGEPPSEWRQDFSGYDGWLAGSEESSEQ